MLQEALSLVAAADVRERVGIQALPWPDTRFVDGLPKAEPEDRLERREDGFGFAPRGAQAATGSSRSCRWR
jgi:hypothetical protein